MVSIGHIVAGVTTRWCTVRQRCTVPVSWHLPQIAMTVQWSAVGWLRQEEWTCGQDWFGPRQWRAFDRQAEEGRSQTIVHSYRWQGDKKIWFIASNCQTLHDYSSPKKHPAVSATLQIRHNKRPDQSGNAWWKDERDRARCTAFVTILRICWVVLERTGNKLGMGQKPLRHPSHQLLCCFRIFHGG